MGYDRIAYFEDKEAGTTLISADKNSAHVIYGNEFRFFAQHLGFAVRHVVDQKDAMRHVVEINCGNVQLADLPASTTAEVIAGSRVAREGIFVELSPPVDDGMTRILNAYFESHCDPSDAGLILDYRVDPPQTIGGY